MKLALPPLHPGQMEVFANPSRFRVVVAGRRWGKTRLAVVEAIAAAARGGAVWWVAPTYDMARAGWGSIVGLLGLVPGVEVKAADRMVRMPGGGTIWVRSADNPQRLRAFGLDLLVLDEAAFVRREVWTEALRPALADRQGRALFISTPYGKNWFWELVQAAESTPGWRVWRYPSSTNPFLHPDELEVMRRDMPAHIYRQEVEGEFVDGGARLVRREWLRVAAPPPQEALRVYQGVDLAISTREDADYTAVVTIGRDGEGRVWVLDAVRARATFHQTLQLVQSQASRWSPVSIAIEAVQYQAAVVQELLRTTALPVVAVRPDRDKLTRALPLIARYEQGLVWHAPSLPREFEEELLAFPVGEHDDQVDALVYAFLAEAMAVGLTPEDQRRYAAI